jgi:hypothetical protein
MARYSYTVQDSKGETSTGAVEANDENEAINTLQSKGYFILSISADTTSKGFALKSNKGGGSVALRDMVFFAEQLATLLNGGVSITTKGDANNVEDSPIKTSDVVGRAVYIGKHPFRIPYLGSVARGLGPKIQELDQELQKKL